MVITFKQMQMGHWETENEDSRQVWNINYICFGAFQRLIYKRGIFLSSRTRDANALLIDDEFPIWMLTLTLGKAHRN